MPVKNTWTDPPSAGRNWFSSRSWLFWTALSVAIVIGLAVTVIVGIFDIGAGTMPLSEEIIITISVGVGFTIAIVTVWGSPLAFATEVADRSSIRSSSGSLGFPSYIQY